MYKKSALLEDTFSVSCNRGWSRRDEYGQFTEGYVCCIKELAIYSVNISDFKEENGLIRVMFYINYFGRNTKAT
jgi:hypothetical protein